MRLKGVPIALWAALSALSAGLLVFSQTLAWYGDEGFHLLAAQLIHSGKKPYLDFFYPQTPLYAYLNAGWMQLFGETWRSAHALSALLTIAGAGLAAGFVLKRLPEPGWRVAAAILTALLIGLHPLVIRFGTIGQPYGLCLFLIVASFRLVIEAAESQSAALSLWAGVCAGAAASSSLLTAPVPLILFVWIARHNLGGDRLRKCAWFAAGAGIPFLPLVGLAVQGPRQVFFNVFEFHFLHRSPGFRASLWANAQSLTDWLETSQGLLLLAAAGLWFVVRGDQWDARRQAEFSLCGWLAAGLGVFLATARPTFSQYFVLLIPFLSILASVSAPAIGSGGRGFGRPVWLAVGLIALFAAGPIRLVWQQQQQLRWSQLEDVAREVNRVTPDEAPIWADEAIYFAARRAPPSGLEHSDSHKLRLPPARASTMHVVPRPQLYEWVGSGRFATVASCWATDDWIESSGLRKVYARHTKVHSCDIFWDRISR